MCAEHEEHPSPPTVSTSGFEQFLDALLARGGHPQRIQHIYELGVTAAVCNAAAALLLGLAMRDALPDTVICLWVGLISAKAYYYFTAKRRGTHLRLTRISGRTRRMMAIFAAIAGILWAPGPLAVMLYLDGHLQTYALGLTLILLLGGVVVYAVIPLFVLCFMTGMIGPLIVYHLTLLTVEGLFFGSSIVILMLVLMVFSLKYSAIIAAGEAREDQRKRAMDLLRAAHSDIKTLADRDPVTALLNRRALVTHLERAIASGAEAPQGRNYALYVIDLDHFKHINDTYGHDRGDQYLIGVGRRLLATVRDRGIIARLGGDEFAVVTANSLSAREIQDFGKMLIQTLSGTIKVAEADLRLGASIGVATTPADCTTVREWLSYADQCLIAAKATQRGTLRQFCSKDRRNLKRRKAMASTLDQAIEAGDIKIAYQPQLNLLTNEVCAIEALARWTGPDDTPIPPPEMFALAESSGSVLALCDAVYHRVACDLTDLNLAQRAQIQLSVNVHQAQLYHSERLRRQLSWLCEALGGADRITLEITENSIVNRGAEEVPTLLGVLAQEGFRISLDDFGTGYASLTHIRDLPLHEVKVDRSFVTHLDSTPEDQEIVRSVLAIGHARGLNVVAEGIETPQQLSVLRELGCTVGQGYLFEKPLPPSQLLPFLNSAYTTRAVGT